jgi:hypothetical protein
MTSMDDFRFRSHQLLIELDAATTQMMMLVSARQATGPGWDAANQRQHDAFQAWESFSHDHDGQSLH